MSCQHYSPLELSEHASIRDQTTGNPISLWARSPGAPSNVQAEESAAAASLHVPTRDVKVLAICLY